MIVGDIVLHDYANSTAAYRVRLALHIKHVEYETHIIDLLNDDQHADAYLARNPQGLIPMLSIDGYNLTQSLAIIDYLDARYPQPKMVCGDPAQRAITLAHALVVAADIHPINNLRVWQYLKDPFGHSQDDVVQWMHHWMHAGFTALEQHAPHDGLFGGETPNLVDICYFAQMHNANRFQLPMDDFPKLRGIERAMKNIPEVAAAHPDMLTAN